MKMLKNFLKCTVFIVSVLGLTTLNTEMLGFFCSSAFAALPPALQKPIYAKCAKCGKEIKPNDRALKTQDGKVFCSEKCFQASLPVCSVCANILSGGFYKSKDGKNLYCSEKCLSTSWPACSMCGKKVSEGMNVSGAGGKNFFCNICFCCIWILYYSWCNSYF